MAWRRTFDQTYDPAKELLGEIKWWNGQLAYYVELQKRKPGLTSLEEVILGCITMSKQLLGELRSSVQSTG